MDIYDIYMDVHGKCVNGVISHSDYFYCLAFAIQHQMLILAILLVCILGVSLRKFQIKTVLNPFTFTMIPSRIWHILLANKISLIITKSKTFHFPLPRYFLLSLPKPIHSFYQLMFNLNIRFRPFLPKFFIWIWIYICICIYFLKYLSLFLQLILFFINIFKQIFWLWH